jgi:hypothetical protein
MIDPRLADSEATRMLAAALMRASKERGLSLRKIGPKLGYKQAVVLSHMATGRVPIPIDKAEKLAQILEIDPARFLKAVLRQRHPDVNLSLLSDASDAFENSSYQELAVRFGQMGNDLTEEQYAVMKEVAADRHPRRRWLSPEEAAAIEALRAAWLQKKAESEPPPA